MPSKKLKNKLIAIVMTLGMFMTACTTTVKTSSVENYVEYNEQNNIINQSTNSNILESYAAGIIRTPSNAAKKTARAFDELPPRIKNLYKYTRGSITIIDDTIDNMHFAGKYIPLRNDILIKKNARHLKMTLFHEIGHMLDFKYYPGAIILSKSRTFKDIYKEEKSNFRTDHSELEYFIADSTEYFAQAFAEYLLKPERLQERCPKTYEYIDYRVNNYGL